VNPIDKAEPWECDPKETLLENFEIEEDVIQFLEHEKQMEMPLAKL
jgi:hypothetical protein